MSLIFDLKELQHKCGLMEEKTKNQQAIYYAVISGLVKLHQKYRLEKQYLISDELRSLVNSVGIQIVQGTAGYNYEEIPKSLSGRQVDDTWGFK